MTEWPKGSVVALAGGVGGARLVDGLDRVLPGGALRIVVNTGDDFRHWGLHISPDLDTVMYTLAGLSPQDRGWGIDGDTFHTLAEAERRGDESWFRLGDRDLVTHLRRSEALARGQSLTEATQRIARSLGVERELLPMSDRPRPTRVRTRDQQTLSFQDWLVRARAAPAVEAIDLGGPGPPAPSALAALADAKLVVICPSNPFVSIEPILALEGVRDALASTNTIAVSPILGGSAVKGPLASMITELRDVSASAEAVAKCYDGLIDAYVVHDGDAFDAPYPVLETNILIPSTEDRVRLAREVLDFARDRE